jgi:hypothetical protein
MHISISLVVSHPWKYTWVWISLQIQTRRISNIHEYPCVYALYVSTYQHLSVTPAFQQFLAISTIIVRTMDRNIKSTIRIWVIGIRKYGSLVIWASRKGQLGIRKILCLIDMWVPHVSWISTGQNLCMCLLHELLISAPWNSWAQSALRTRVRQVEYPWIFRSMDKISILGWVCSSIRSRSLVDKRLRFLIRIHLVVFRAHLVTIISFHLLV